MLQRQYFKLLLDQLQNDFEKISVDPSAYLVLGLRLIVSSMDLIQVCFFSLDSNRFDTSMNRYLDPLFC